MEPCRRPGVPRKGKHSTVDTGGGAGMDFGHAKRNLHNSSALPSFAKLGSQPPSGRGPSHYRPSENYGILNRVSLREDGNRSVVPVRRVAIPRILAEERGGERYVRRLSHPGKRPDTGLPERLPMTGVSSAKQFLAEGVGMCEPTTLTAYILLKNNALCTSS